MTLSVPCPIAIVTEIYSAQTNEILQSSLGDLESSDGSAILGYVQDFTREDFAEGLAIKNALTRGSRSPVPIDRIWNRMSHTKRSVIPQLQLDRVAFHAIDMSSTDFEDDNDVIQFRAIYLKGAIILTAKRLANEIDKILESPGFAGYTEDSIGSLVTIILPQVKSNHEALRVRPYAQSVVDLANSLLQLSDGADDILLEMPDDFDPTLLTE
jgi:hypothetical protein